MSGGGRFDFDDGGTYCGGWEDGKAHGFGVCTGPKGQGEYAGAWHNGFEISGVYTWPSGNTYEGQWTQGKRHGVGIETKGKWVYRGEWTQGFKGRYGTRISITSGAKFEGTWTTGLQDGYGVESYADGGTYQGQWLRGMRHGYGVRQSVPYGLAAHYRPQGLRASLTSLRSDQEDDNTVRSRDRRVDEGRGGFVLTTHCDTSPEGRRRSILSKEGRSSIKNSLMKGLKLRKQRSTGDIQESPRRPTGSIRSTVSNTSHVSAQSAVSAMSAVTGMSHYTDSNQSFISQDDIADVNVTETYMGEWKNDKRSGFGVSERTDGLKYEGEWFNNKKYGYGITTFKDGTKEEGKYKNNVLMTPGKKSKIFIIRTSKVRERIDNAVTAAQRAAQIALQKADIANSRMANARAKAEAADAAARKARDDADVARVKAKQFAPDFHQPGPDIHRKNPPMQSPHIPSSMSNPLKASNQMLNHVPNLASRSMSQPASRRQDSVGSLNRNQAPLEIRSNKPDTPGVGGAPPQSHTNTLPASTANHVGAGPSMRSASLPRQSSMRAQEQRIPETPGDMDTHRQMTLLGNGGPGMTIPITPNSTQMNYHSPPVPEIRSGYDSDYTSSDSYTRDRSSLDRFSEDRYSVQMTPVSYSPYHSPMNPNVNSSSPFLAQNPGSPVYSREKPVPSPSEFRKSRSLQRRKSTPSIVVHDKEKKKASSQPKSRLFRSSSPTGSDKSSQEESDTFIIEDGRHKKIKAEVYNRPPSPTPSVTSTTSYVEEKPKDLPRRIKIEPTGSLLRSRNMGSMPDVSEARDMKKNVMPRSEVSKLSQARREELIMLKEYEERRSKWQIVLRLADMKDWCQQRKLLMVVILINISIVMMFVNLLNQ